MLREPQDGIDVELKHKRVIVVGLGRSGVAACRLCHERGAHVLATDQRPANELSEAARELPVELVLGGHAGVDWTWAELCVVSPGVPPMPGLDAAARAGVEIIGELELACRFLSAPILAIGGTNGKSTTTSLLAAMLGAAGQRVFAGGNLGQPASHAVGNLYDAVVLEVSSFQLERAPRFKPRVSVLLNITEDHLDRYPSFAAYAAAKGNAFVNQGGDDWAVVPAADARCIEQAQRGQGRLSCFGPGAEFQVQSGRVLRPPPAQPIDIRGVPLHGAHNARNLEAAVAAATVFGLDAEGIEKGLRQFEPLPHRMQRVLEWRGVRFYDDSKATNVSAAVTAISGLDEAHCVVIAGGRDKHGDYAPLVSALRAKARAVMLIGEAAERMARAIGQAVPVEHCRSMQHAVERAWRWTRPGDAVLLSPACSSFDMFDSYAHRGEEFAKAARALTGDATEVTQ